VKGLGVSPGIVMGQVYVDWKEQIEIEKDYVDDPEGEIERFNLAVATANDEITQLYERENRVIDVDEAGPDLYRVHGESLHDPEFLDEIRNVMRTQNVNAEWAVKSVAEKFAQVFEGIDDDSMKARADDIKDVCARVCRLLLHIEGNDLSRKLKEGLILICKNIGTTEIGLLQKENIIGLVSEEGTIGSHSIIMARNQHKPAVVGIAGIANDVYHGDFIIVDGNSGEVLINPDGKTIEEYKHRQELERRFEAKLRDYIGKPVRTADGISLNVYGNAASESDVKSIVEIDGHGVGLYRTEYIYLTRDHLPSEGEQLWEYKKTLLAMKGRPVVFRTLDIGGDKIPPYLNMPEEQNPALGQRAIRYSLSRVDIFRTQIKALLRASAFGDVSILLPMIATLGELRLIKNIINDVKEELKKEKVAFNPKTQIGVMIETPSAAVISDLISAECDFLSIGSNDLIQYTMAVDRLAPGLSYLYSPFFPSVLRMVQTVIRNGANAGKMVSLCGEMAGEPLLSPILFGMGLRTFSMNPSEMLRAQWLLSQLNEAEMRVCADDVLNLGTEKEVRQYCKLHFARFTSAHLNEGSK